MPASLRTRTLWSGCSSPTWVASTSGTDAHVRPLGSHRRASMSSVSLLWTRRGTTATGTRKRVSVHMSFLLFLGGGLRGEGLGIPSPLLGCHSSCCRGKSGSGECGLLPGTVRGGRHGEGRVVSGLPSYSVASGAGAHRALVTDVPVIIQLVFLQYFENVEVPQIPSSTECCRFQL